MNKTKQFVFIASAAALFTYFGSKTGIGGAENKALDSFKSRTAQNESILTDSTKYDSLRTKIRNSLMEEGRHEQGIAEERQIADSTKNVENLLSEKKSDSLKAANERISEIKKIADSTGNAILEKKGRDDSLATATKLEVKRVADSLTVARNAEAQRKADSLKTAENRRTEEVAQYKATRDSVLNAYDYLTKNDWMLENANEALTAKFGLILEFVEKNAKTCNVELYRDFYAVKELVKGREKYFAGQKAKISEEKKRRQGLEVIEPSPLRIDTSSAIVPIKVPDTTDVKAPEKNGADSTGKEQVEPSPLKNVAVPKNEKPPVKENNEPPKIKEENSGKETIRW